MGLEPEQVSTLFFVGIGNQDVGDQEHALLDDKDCTTKGTYGRIMYRVRALRTD